ncbi:MAG: type II toxin-antitoxin system VapC family toxin [Planctomycetes bacterium]|nr:type II toxin-antitoxin system VapC family toxin [Planctomycetota bacterium]
MIVVDTNTIGYLYLASARSAQAEQALVKDPDWVAPLLWRSEFRNVLAHYIRRKLLALDEAERIADEAMGLMRGREHEVASSDVLRLVAGSKCSAYDCEFVALAQHLGVRLVTVDKEILDQFPEVAVSLEAFIAS